ncbi:hypothetical protein C8R47DRAFT_1222848 [Mycena vitilis]|nr:hypothetical protein C8R47DRAFT_1222848 [Mycena vitilis]
MSSVNRRLITFPDDCDPSLPATYATTDVQLFGAAVEESRTDHSDGSRSTANTHTNAGMSPPSLPDYSPNRPTMVDTRAPSIGIQRPCTSERVESPSFGLAGEPSNSGSDSPTTWPVTATPSLADSAPQMVLPTNSPTTTSVYEQLGLVLPLSGASESSSARVTVSSNEAVMAARLLRVGQDVASLETATSMRYGELLELIKNVSAHNACTNTVPATMSASSEEIYDLRGALASTRTKLAEAIDVLNDLRSDVDILKATIDAGRSPQRSYGPAPGTTLPPLPDILPRAGGHVVFAGTGRGERDGTATRVRARETTEAFPASKRLRFAPSSTGGYCDVHVFGHDGSGATTRTTF